jgi:hypothetical protein
MKTLVRHSAWIAMIILVVAACFYHPLAGNQTLGRWFEVETSNDTKLRRTVRVMGGAPLAQTEAHPLREGASIAIAMDPTQWRLMLIPNNRKLYKERQTSVLISLDGGQPFPAMLSLRGMGSLRDPQRPPFDIRLSRSVTFDTGVSLRRIYLMNMRWDKSELNFALGCRLLRELRLFSSHSQFVKVSVNGQPLGIMYLIEPAESSIRRTFNDVVGIYRRRNVNAYTTEWSAPIPDAGASLRQLTSYASAGALDDPVADLEDVLDLDTYFRWVILNSLILNNDIRDDMYLYERRRDGARPGRLVVYPWDYDDLFIAELRHKAMDDPIIFGSNDPLDFLIQRHPPLYERLKRTGRELLGGALSLEHLETVLRETQHLRDSMDDGTDPSAQEHARTLRAELVSKALETLRERHGELSVRVGL